MKHEDDHGMNGDSNLSHSVRASNKEDSQKDNDTNWQQERETTKTKDLQCMMAHAFGINYAHRFPKCSRSLHTLLGISLYTSCRQFQFVAVPLYSISDLYANSLLRFTLREDGSFEVLSLHLPSVTVDRRQL